MEIGSRQITALIATLVIIAAGVSLYLGQRSPRTQPDLTPLEMAGEALVEETARLLGGQGRILLVVREDQVRGKSPQWVGFQAALKKHPGLVVVPSAPLPAPAEPVEAPTPETTSLPAADYFALLGQHGDVDAIVSLAGPPFLQDQDWARLGARRPPFVALCASHFQLGQLFEAGLVRVAVAPRRNAVPPDAPPPTTRREQFDRVYEVLTAETVSGGRLGAER